MLLNNNRTKMKNTVLFIFITLFLACGIKKAPLPPVEDYLKIKRIGDYIYILSSEDIKVEGFVFHKGVWYKREKRAFCFSIVKDKEKRNICVDEAIKLKPFINIKEKKDRVEVNLSGFSKYFIYPYRRGWLYVKLGKSVKGNEIHIKRYESEKCYAITGVVDKRESEPAVLCVKPQRP